MTAPSTTEEYGALRDMMIEIRTELRVLIAQHAATTQDHETRIRTLESRADVTTQVAQNSARIRALEQFRWLITGAAATGGGALGALIAQLLGAR